MMQPLSLSCESGRLVVPIGAMVPGAIVTREVCYILATLVATYSESAVD
jgi:hypothetical protein